MLKFKLPSSINAAEYFNGIWFTLNDNRYLYNLSNNQKIDLVEKFNQGHKYWILNEKENLYLIRRHMHDFSIAKIDKKDLFIKESSDTEFLNLVPLLPDYTFDKINRSFSSFIYKDVLYFLSMNGNFNKIRCVDMRFKTIGYAFRFNNNLVINYKDNNFVCKNVKIEYFRHFIQQNEKNLTEFSFSKFSGNKSSINIDNEKNRLKLSKNNRYLSVHTQSKILTFDFEKMQESEFIFKNYVKSFEIGENFKIFLTSDNKITIFSEYEKNKREYKLENDSICPNVEIILPQEETSFAVVNGKHLYVFELFN